MRGVHPEDAVLYQRSLKRCYRCGIVKSFAEFHAAKVSERSHSGRQSWCIACKRKDGKEYYERMRLEALRKYSVTPFPSCTCCGETIVAFLAIDHINGGGRQQRQRDKCGSGFGFMQWLRRHDYPEGFQTLCHNCNSAKHTCGTCPHQVGE